MLFAVRDRFIRLIVDDRGLETIEYAIITGLIVLATITAVGAISIWVATQFEFFQNQVGA